MTSVADIPRARTPAGGWTEFPPPVLAGCDDPLVEGAPDLRGVWRTVSVDAQPAVIVRAAATATHRIIIDTLHG